VTASRREGREHPVLLAAALAWTFVAAGICLPALALVDRDALVLVGSASALGLGAGATSAWLVRTERLGWAAAALAASAVVTPTYFAYVVNLVPLAAAVACLRRR
jgi:hypothetical protein